MAQWQLSSSSSGSSSDGESAFAEFAPPAPVVRRVGRPRKYPEGTTCWGRKLAKRGRQPHQIGQHHSVADKVCAPTALVQINATSLMREVGCRDASFVGMLLEKHDKACVAEPEREKISALVR